MRNDGDLCFVVRNPSEEGATKIERLGHILARQQCFRSERDTCSSISRQSERKRIAFASFARKHIEQVDANGANEQLIMRDANDASEVAPRITLEGCRTAEARRLTYE
jgi:hypothetical protein